jgi:hypothetical protein
MTPSLTNPVKAFALVVLGLAIAALAAFSIHAVAAAAPLFAQPPDVPSVMASAPPPQYAAAVERARELVRAAVLEQNLPGLSVAVGAGSPAGALAKVDGALVWAEGFGWRDVGTRTPVTPNTRFNIGTAASAVTAAAVASLGLTGTGVESAVKWSPEQIGEPGEDFPLFTLVLLEVDFFFVVFLRLAELVCFFFDVWVVPGCGAITKAVNTNRARALSLRYCILSG